MKFPKIFWHNVLNVSLCRKKTRIKELLNCFLEEIELWTFVERRVGAVLGVPVALPGPPAGRGQQSQAS